MTLGGIAYNRKDGREVTRTTQDYITANAEGQTPASAGFPQCRGKCGLKIVDGVGMPELKGLILLALAT